MRAGRFDRKVRILRPDEEGRYEVLQVRCTVVWCGVVCARVRCAL